MLNIQVCTTVINHVSLSAYRRGGEGKKERKRKGRREEGGGGGGRGGEGRERGERGEDGHKYHISVLSLFLCFALCIKFHRKEKKGEGEIKRRE